MVVMAAPVDTGRWPDHVAGEWTVEDLETLPDNGLRYELLDGTLLVTPSPTPRHQGAILELAVLLRTACLPDHRVLVAPRVPSIQVYDLVDGAYVLVAEAAGPVPVSVTEPFAVTVIPDDLIDI